MHRPLNFRDRAEFDPRNLIGTVAIMFPPFFNGSEGVTCPNSSLNFRFI